MSRGTSSLRTITTSLLHMANGCSTFATDLFTCAGHGQMSTATGRHRLHSNTNLMVDERSLTHSIGVLSSAHSKSSSSAFGANVSIIALGDETTKSTCHFVGPQD
uniref:Uncharacterized protein n=1 Tax=Trypanosoma vivax (strain Y486) TaxID=1055687 RepID=G0UAS9_TRYVY|nr:hypothetical protein, unlikely [Trypanosoma vivax Y486]